MCRWRSWCRSSTGRFSSRPGNSKGVSRRFSTTRNTAPRRASCTTTRARCSIGSSMKSCCVARAPMDSGRRVRRRRHRGLPRAATAGELTRFNMLRQQEAVADARPNLSLADFVAPSERRPRRSHRRIRGDGGPRRRRSRAHVRARARRLQRDYRQGARGSARRGVRGVSARAARREWGFGEALDPPTTTSLPSGTAASVRDSDIRRARITARSSSCSSCSVREARDQLTEHAAMMPAASVSGLYFANPRRATSPWAASARIRLRRTHGERADRSNRSSGGIVELSYEPGRC